MEYLVNPIFDLEEIFKNARADVDQKYAKVTDGQYPVMGTEDLMDLYSQTFNAPLRSRFVYDKMIAKYDEFFDKQK